MNVRIEIIPHSSQRYETVGDWFFHHGDLVIRVSELGDWRKEMLIAVHELVEVLLCRHQGVTQEQVDKFDMEFEQAREEGDLSEPGDDPKAPYKRQHCIATGVERMLAAELEVDWKTYEEQLELL